MIKSNPADRLNTIAQNLREGQQAETVTVHNFLDWFGVQRRGFAIVKQIRQALDSAGLITEPDFEGAYRNSDISFRLKSTELAGSSSTSTSASADLSVVVVSNANDNTLTESASVNKIALATPLMGARIQDPTQRIGKLDAANTSIISVKPESTLGEAVTLMLAHDFSQLPVMQNERTVKGIISWKSIGARVALQGLSEVNNRLVKDFMDKRVIAIGSDESWFSAIPSIVDHEYVLVVDGTRKVTGIVTATDLSGQFLQLSEPFLLLGEIENHIRNLISGKVTLEDVKEFCATTDQSRTIEAVDDLTFGEYVRLLENENLWRKINLNIDRVAFVNQLDNIREIRNDVMHFDPEGVEEDRLQDLRKFVRFLRALSELGTT